MNTTLVEPGVKYFFNETLKQCHKTKHNYYNSLFNLSLSVIFVGIVGSILFMNYNSQNKEYHRREKRKIQEQYLASTIHKIKQEQQRERGQMITNIPEFESIEHSRTKQFM